jgi:hypothetical protein
MSFDLAVGHFIQAFLDRDENAYLRLAELREYGSLSIGKQVYRIARLA